MVIEYEAEKYLLGSPVSALQSALNSVRAQSVPIL